MRALGSFIAFRYIYDHRYISPSYNTHGHLRVSYRYTYFMGNILKGIFDCQQPTYLYDMLTLRNDVHGLNLRGDCFDIHRHQTAKFECCFSFVAVRMLNDGQLYGMIQDMSRSVFKSQYRKLIFNRQTLV